MEVHCLPDCGNAPRKQILKDLMIAFARADKEYITKMIAPDVVWKIAGKETFCGKTDCLQGVSKHHKENILTLDIKQIITHGKTAAVHGEIILENKNILFCDVFEFASAGKQALIKEITSFQTDG